MINKLILMLMFSLVSNYVFAHHSRASFLIDKTISLSGVVEKISWRNPHVYITLKVINEKGQPESWLMEGHSTSGLIANGWSKNSVKMGDNITTIANPNRNPKYKNVLIDHVKYSDGRTYYAFRKAPEINVIANSTKNNSENPGMLAAPSNDFSGNWAYPRPLKSVLLLSKPIFETLPLTNKGKEEAATYSPDDAPSYDCIGTGIPRLIFTSYQYRWLRQKDRIIIEKQQTSADSTRTIYLDDKAIPANHIPDILGISVGKFTNNDKVLEVKTTGFSPTRWGITTGIPSSDKKVVFEKYRLTNLGLKLMVEVKVEDPVYLLEPLYYYGVYDKKANMEFEHIPCDPDTAKLHMQFEE